MQKCKFLSVTILILLVVSCDGGDALENPKRPSTQSSLPSSNPSSNSPLDRATYALEVVKGYRQEYRGGQSCPVPIVIRLYSYKQQKYLAANSPDDAMLTATLKGTSGRMSEDFESFGNYCGDYGRICFGARYFAPSRDKAYTLDFELHIYSQITGEHVSGSPYSMSHRILPQ